MTSQTLPEEIRDQIEDKPARQVFPDAISEAVGDTGYVQRAQFDDCRRVFPEIKAYGQKMVFARFYFNARLLIDVFDEREAPLGEVDFKREWCESHGYRYAVLSDPDDLDPIRVALTDQPEPQADTPKPRKRAPAKPRKTDRGKVQRPRSR